MKFPNKLVNPERVWFMSDLHYDHENILKFNNGRPFKDITEMNEYILQTLKDTLEPEDILFDLGDLFWKTEQSEMEALCNLLPKQTYKIIGNHDKERLYYPGGILQRYFKLTADLLDINLRLGDEEIQLTLSHYPILEWNHKYHGSLNIHGHCHGNIDSLNTSSKIDLRMDIGFDSAVAKKEGSFLIPLETIITEAKKKTYGLSFRTWSKHMMEG